MAAALRASADVGYEWDLVTDRVSWFGALETMFADAPAESGRAWSAAIHPDDVAARNTALDHHYATRAAYDCEYRVVDEAGQVRWVHDRGAAELAPNGRPLRLAGVLRAIDQRKSYEAELLRRANFDDLTGRFNRKRLQDSLNDVLVQARYFQTRASYFVVGIDKMPVIVEAFGTERADEVLVCVGKRLEESLRDGDLIGRVGPAEFGILLPRCPDDHLPIVAHKLLRAFRAAPLRLDGAEYHVTLSIGAVSLPGAAETGGDAMAKAELALDQARDRGHDCWVQYHWSLDQQHEQRAAMELGEEVMTALKRDRAMFAFQPVVDSRGGAVAFYECLLRIPGQDGKVLPAHAFIPAVERLGLTRILDQHVLNMAIAELMEHQGFSIALNISGLTVSDRSWLRRLTGMIRNRPDVAERLIVEITETVAMQDIEQSMHFVHTLRDHGCRVALDDFGAGYTSFRQLKALAVDIVKIDGSFVRNLPHNTDNQLFVRTLLELANGLKLKTVAEFVETDAEAAMLLDMGVELLQGYYFGKPGLARPWTSGAQGNEGIVLPTGAAA